MFLTKYPGMKFMKILLVNKGVFPWLGGIETAVRMYANAYRDLGHTVTILVTHQSKGLDTIQESLDGIKVIRCRTNLRIFNLNISLDLIKYIIKNSLNFDLVHFNEPHYLGLLAFLFAKKKTYVISYHAELTKFSFLPKLLETIFRRIYKGSSYIIIGNPTLTYRRGVVNENADRVKLIPYCDDILPRKSEEVKLKWDIPSKYFFAFSRYSHYKGFEVLEESINMVEGDINFVFAISGDMPSDLKNRLISHDNVQLINRNISKDEKSYLFRNSYCYLFPSVNISESFGITQVEALKYGKPIINTYLPSGVPLVSLDNITGLTVFPQNPGELAIAISKMWNLDSAIYKRMSKRCVDRYNENYSYQCFQKNINELLLNLKKR